MKKSEKQRKDGNKRKINGWRKKKWTGFPFNFYFVTFGDGKTRPLKAEVQFFNIVFNNPDKNMKEIQV